MSNDPYREHVLYDLEYAHHDEDVSWYVELCSKAQGSILELGCGTGRLTLPIARAGVSVVGVDRAPSMLDGLQTKLQREPTSVQERVTALLGDYVGIEVPGPFPGVLWPFNALHHCDGPQQVATVLQRIRDWLAPDGFLALDCYLPDLDLYDRDPEQRYEPRSFVDPRSGELLQSWEQGWWDAESRMHHVLYVYEHLDGRQERTQLSLRMYELAELRALFVDGGFAFEHEAMDFSGSPVVPGALKWVGVVRPTAESRDRRRSRLPSRPEDRR